MALQNRTSRSNAKVLVKNHKGANSKKDNGGTDELKDAVADKPDNAFAAYSPAVAFAKSRVYLEDTVPSGSSTSVTITTHKAASFSVKLPVPTAGRARLFLLGKHAPKGGPLIHTSNTSSNN